MSDLSEFLETVRADVETATDRTLPLTRIDAEYDVVFNHAPAMLRLLEATDAAIGEATSNLVSVSAILARQQYDDEVPEATGEAMRHLAITVKANVDALRHVMQDALNNDKGGE